MEAGVQTGVGAGTETHEAGDGELNSGRRIAYSYEDSFVLIRIAGGGVIEFSPDLACKYPGAFFSYFSVFTGQTGI